MIEGTYMVTLRVMPAIDQKQPLQASEASAGSNVPINWKSAANEYSDAIDRAIILLNQDAPATALEVLREAIK